MKAELLAPAGSYEAMRAAINAGADAVYLGGEKFGARAFAENLKEEQLIQAIRECHLHNRKLYLTVNTLLKNREIERELYEYLRPFYENGLDAVIVQDLGVLEFVKTYFPNLPIHASTQMTITGVESAKLLKDAGVSRIVTARELSAAEIRAIYDATHLEIESFIHGALCYCYSGQCLMSSLIGGRSGNRGKCAQPCRLPYEVWQDGKRINDKYTAYPLSPKDMCTVGILPDILDAGVYSLKIEGRMKKPEYTAGVVSVYRKYLDFLLEKGSYPAVEKKDYEMLYAIYNRDGFHQSYYHVRNGRDMMALRNEKKTGGGADIKNKRNETLFETIRERYLKEPAKEKIKGSLILFSDCPAILEVAYHGMIVKTEGSVVQKAQNRPLTGERVRQQMEKTGQTAFSFESLDIQMGGSVFIPMQQLNQLRRDALDLLEKKILETYTADRKAVKRNEGITKEANTESAAGESAGTENIARGSADAGKGVTPVFSASVTTREQWDALLPIPQIRRIYADCALFSKENFEEEVLQAVRETEAQGKECYLMLPHMVRDRELNGRKEYFQRLSREGLAGYLVRNLESFGILKSLGLEKDAVLDANLYTMNAYSQRFWQKQGVARDTIPVELNEKEITYRDNSRSELLVYGYLPMMVSVQCVQKNLRKCNHNQEHFMLKDRYQKEFPVVCNCDFCYNTIYNTVPLSLLTEWDRIKAMGAEGYRLSFTMENGRDTKKIAEAFLCAFGGADAQKQTAENGSRRKPAKKLRLNMETTKGHFCRGV